MKHTAIIFFVTIFFTSTMCAQNDTSKKVEKQTPFALGVVDQIQSGVLKENRTLNIYLPEGYSADSTARYQVIYIGNLYFAGEHCSSNFQGFMNGAAETGRIAARTIAQSIKSANNVLIS